MPRVGLGIPSLPAALEQQWCRSAFVGTSLLVTSSDLLQTAPGACPPGQGGGSLAEDRHWEEVCQPSARRGAVECTGLPPRPAGLSAER